MPIHLQPRDLAAMSEVGDFGTMSSDQIFHRHYTNEETEVKRVYFNRRMRTLVKAGWLDRQDVVLSGNKGVQKQPSVFRLTPDGASEVLRHTGYEPPRVARSEAPSALTLMHRVGITTTLIAFKDATAKENIAPARWLLESDKEPGAKVGQTRDKQYVLYESYSQGRDRYTCRPDASVAVKLPNKHTLLAYIEYDRSTEGKDQIQRTKLNGYSLMFGSKTYLQHWPNTEKPAPRIMFICKSKQRIENLQTWLASSTLDREYNFTLHEHLSENLFSAPIWWKLRDDVNGPARSIFPKKG